MKFNSDGQQNLTQPTDELDRMLDAALAKYATVEPRAGLEGRVLAHMRSEPLLLSRRVWLQWGLAAAVAAIALVAVLAWRSSRAPDPVIANLLPATIQRQSIQGAKPTPHATDEVSSAKAASLRKPAARRAPESGAGAHPKLEQFPSPQPLSAEEIALAKYVENFPKEAGLVAQAQEEFDLETLREMNSAGLQNRPSDSIQQER
jgi:hypothetical protein